jgi:5'(3')-deoxyribonucleotidase
MRILVDLDGIVVDTLPSWLKRVHETTGILAKPADITKWNLIDNPPLDQLQLQQLLDILNEKDFNINLPQMSDASHYLHQLHNAGHDISIVTARSGTHCMPETLTWLKKMMPWLDVEKKVWFCYDKQRITGDVLIDDKAETLIKYKEAHPEAHLITIDYPYNQHAPEETHRVQKNGYEWEQIESIIIRISNDLSKH